MSETLLKAILRLFAQVAKEGEVTRQERDQIRTFLEEHLSMAGVETYLGQFDTYSQTLSETTVSVDTVRQLCMEINPQLTQKQKVIIVLELINIIQADGSISEQEEELVGTIGDAFKISRKEIDAIKIFVLGQSARDLDHPDILIVDSKPAQPNQKARHMSKHHLDGVIAILHLVENEVYFIKYVGNTDVFLNGVPMKPGKMSVLSVGSLVRWDKDEPVYYGSILKVFKSFPENNRIAFEARNITYRFKNGKLGLRDVNLSTESGNLIALMGASGAGKSTLLHVLNGSETPSEGTVTINGIDIHRSPKKIEGVIGFVPQDDLLIEDLT
ncbi:MAG TPA: ATP-binding cassette domain-containing protein, partial [Chryseosolibacter sp.]|nr:ATP-binding cassette domain-containing protein [Chryseosolibacter sp.]